MSTAETSTEAFADTRAGVADTPPDCAPVPAADVFTASTTFQVMQSIRLDLGYGSRVHP